MKYSYLPILLDSSKMTQQLMAKAKRYGDKSELSQLQHLDAELMRLIDECKMSQLSNEQQQAQGYTHYIWHTQGDGKVRSRHAARDGQTFAWNNPPAGGHPGEDYGCRCWAEPVEVTGLTSIILKTVIIFYLDGIKKWNSLHMSLYFYTLGSERTLDDMGHRQDVINYYERNYLARFTDQLISRARETQDGHFTDSFEASYDFQNLFFAYGNSTVGGRFSGKITTSNNGKRVLKGKVEFYLRDIYTDPLSIREIAIWIANNRNALFLNFTEYENIDETDVNDFIKVLSELGGRAYVIRGQWNKDIRLEF